MACHRYCISKVAVTCGLSDIYFCHTGFAAKVLFSVTTCCYLCNKVSAKHNGGCGIKSKTYFIDPARGNFLHSDL